MASMKDLLARAQTTRKEIAPDPIPHQNESFAVPLCVNCGAPREAAEGAEHGKLSAICRFCKQPAGG